MPTNPNKGTDYQLVLSKMKSCADSDDIFHLRGAGTYAVTGSRPWARENQVHFPTYDFITIHANVESIERFLIEQRNFQRVVNMPDFVLIQNVDPNLIL
jgi:hypothetical protein